jgi:hypothetical protein
MTAHRRTIGLDSFNHEVKKHTERTTKQMTSIFALVRGIMKKALNLWSF